MLLAGLSALTHWTPCSLWLWREFNRWQHRDTLLTRGIKVYVDAGKNRG